MIWAVDSIKITLIGHKALILYFVQKDGDIQHFVTALKDIINLVQDIREDYALREISG